MINYSIIIPHKNIPALLQRCLDSIPRREDVQIIVVDDNSDADKVDFANFPGLNDPFVEVVFGKNENGRKGAGYARNVGLERAKGKWLIFADADDFFNPCFQETLDKYKDDENDIVFFKATSVDSVTGEIGDRDQSVNWTLSEIQRTGNWDIAFSLCVPWAKFIKRTIVQTNNILFQEVSFSDDLMFLVELLLLSDLKKTICEERIYCITYRKDSLTGKTTVEKMLVAFNVCCQVVTRLKPYNKENLYTCYVAGWWIKMRGRSPWMAARCFFLLLKTCGFLFVFSYVFINNDLKKIKRKLFFV